MVLDKLNTHFRNCLDDALGARAAEQLLHHVQFHDTPKHASWLSMAEIEIGIPSRQCLDQCIGSGELLPTKVEAWQQARNTEQPTIKWNFTGQDVDRKLGAIMFRNLRVDVLVLKAVASCRNVLIY